MTIPTKVTEEQFQKYFELYLSKAKRGYVSKIPLFKIFNYILYTLYTGCQWNQLPIDCIKSIKRDKNSMLIVEPTEDKEISYQAVYYHFRKWSRDGSLQTIFRNSIKNIKEDLNLSEINLDGTHTIGKKGGESVKYQGRKKAKTSNIIPIIDKQGFILATTKILPGNNNDLFEFEKNLKQIIKELKSLGLTERLKGTYFNADAGFDSRKSRKICFNHNLIPNVVKNLRNSKKVKPGRKRLFNKEIYNNRFAVERSFAWVDKFKRLIIRFERLDVLFLSLHFIAFTLINLRFLLNEKV